MQMLKRLRFIELLIRNQDFILTLRRTWPNGITDGRERVKVLRLARGMHAAHIERARGAERPMETFLETLAVAALPIARGPGWRHADRLGGRYQGCRAPRPSIPIGLILKRASVREGRRAVHFRYVFEQLAFPEGTLHCSRIRICSFRGVNRFVARLTAGWLHGLKES